MEYYPSFDFFPQLFKNLKTILGWQAEHSGEKGLDLAHGLEWWGVVSVQTLPELELHAPPSLGILSWGTMSV